MQACNGPYWLFESGLFEIDDARAQIAAPAHPRSSLLPKLDRFRIELAYVPGGDDDEPTMRLSKGA